MVSEAVIYCRVSHTKQKSEGDGLHSQEHRCREYCAARGYSVIKVFQDDVSGHGDFMSRRGMVHLLHFLAAGVAWLQYEGRIGGTAKCPIDRYRFPPQDSSMRGKEGLYAIGGAKLGEVVRICFDNWTIDIKKRQDSADVHPSSIFAHDHVEARAQSDALLRIASDVAAKGLSDRSVFGVARDLLLRRPPQIQGEPLQFVNESNVSAAIRCVRKMDGGVHIGTVL